MAQSNVAATTATEAIDNNYEQPHIQEYQYLNTKSISNR